MGVAAQAAYTFIIQQLVKNPSVVKDLAKLLSLQTFSVRSIVSLVKMDKAKLLSVLTFFGPIAVEIIDALVEEDPFFEDLVGLDDSVEALEYQVVEMDDAGEVDKADQDKSDLQRALDSKYIDEFKLITDMITLLGSEENLQKLRQALVIPDDTYELRKVFLKQAKMVS